MGSRLHRILVVEPDYAVGRMISLALCYAGFEPISVSSGSDALRALDTLRVEAVVIDPDLSDGLGPAVMHRLSESMRLRSLAVPCVIISAQEAEQLTALYGVAEGRLLAKPFDPWDLVTNLRTLVS